MTTNSPPVRQRPSQLWWSILVLSVPVALQVMLQSLLGMADVLMVGDLGAAAVAAVGLAAKIQFLLLVLMIGVGTACSILVSQYMGAEDYAACRKIVAAALLSGITLMLPFFLLLAGLSAWWVPLINPDTEVAALTTQYLQITALVVIIMQAIAVYESGLRALGNTGVPLLMAALAVSLNIVLNYILIFGHWGMPALGVEGAAWATLISRMVQLLAMLTWLYARRHDLALKREHFIACYHSPLLRRFVVFSAPLVINHVVWGLGNATYHVLSGYAGTDALAVMGVIAPLESLFFALFVGLSNACTVLIGRSLGANRPDEAWRLHQFFDRLTMGLVLLLSCSLYLGRYWVISFFHQLSADSVQLLSQTLSIFCLLVWIKVLNMMRIIGVLRAGGDNKFCLMMDTVAMWVMGLPVFTLAVFWGGVPFLYIYLLSYVEDLSKFVPVVLRIRLRIWMKNLTQGSAQSAR